MAEGLNRVLLLGNLGAEPELRFTQSRKAVLNLRLATPESYQDGSGDWKERTEWHNVVVWGARAEALAKHLRKGARIAVEGRISTTSYDARGEKRYRTDVVASNVVLLDGRTDAPSVGEREPVREEHRQHGRRDDSRQRSPARGATPNPDTFDHDDGVPF